MNTRTVYGRVVKEDSSSRRHGASKTVHALIEHKDGIIEPLCSPKDVGLPMARFTESDVDCIRCKARLLGTGSI